MPDAQEPTVTLGCAEAPFLMVRTGRWSAITVPPKAKGFTIMLEVNGHVNAYEVTLPANDGAVVVLPGTPADCQPA